MATYGPTNPERDGPIYEQFPTFNWGVRTTGNIGHPFSTTRVNTLWAWDVSSIPVGATVTSATLILDVQATSLTSTQAANIYPVTRLIVEGSGNGSATGDGQTWDTYDGTNNWTTAGGDYDASFGSAFDCPTTDTDVTIDVTTAVTKALSDYRSSDHICLIGRVGDALGENKVCTYWTRNAATAGDRPTLQIEYTTSTPLVVTEETDYDPNQAAVSGTLRWALFDQSGDRAVTVDAGVVASGIDLDPSPTYGPVVVENTNCAFNGGGVTVREWGITVATPDVQLEDFVLEPNDSENGRGLVITDRSSQQTMTGITVTDMTVLANGDDPVSVQQQTYGSSFTVAFDGVIVDSADTDIESKGLLVSGPSTGAINGTITYDNCTFGSTEPLASRIPLIFGGLHTFTDCEFVQGWSTTDIKAAHVNWIRCNWVTRAEPGGATYWYAGRLVMVSFPATTRMYFEDCTLDGVAATYEDLCKVRSIAGDADIDPAVISGTLLATVPQNPTPTISSLSPSSYNAGGITNVLATGTGFRPNSTATVNGVSVTATLVDTINGTTISLAVPASVFATPGAFNVVISNPVPGGGNSSAATLTITGLANKQAQTSTHLAVGTI